MRLSKQKHHENELRLTQDARKRVDLGKLLPNDDVCCFRAYTEGDRIILEPIAEIPVRELWLYKHPELLKEVQDGLKQSSKGTICKRRSFAKYAKDEI